MDTLRGYARIIPRVPSKGAKTLWFVWRVAYFAFQIVKKTLAASEKINLIW